MKSITYRLLTCISGVLFVLGLAACQPEAGESTATPTNLEVDPVVITLTDDTEQQLSFDKPAERIVALSPHIVENLYAVGAQDRIVGVSEYSNFPPEAQDLPIVAGFEKINIERIVKLKPDLIMAWDSGNSHSAINRLKELGFKVYMDRPDSLLDVAKSIRAIGLITGLNAVAESVASRYESTLAQIAEQNQNKSKISVFYQVWNSPLQTISGNHIISASIETCGGINIYADEFSVAPIINIESVLERNPEVILASGFGEERPVWLDEWQNWPNLLAVQKQNLFTVNPDHIQRQTTRLVLGVQAICDRLDQARSKSF